MPVTEPFTITCPGCKRQLRYKKAHAGRKIRCPKCSAVVQLPELEMHEPEPELEKEPETNGHTSDDEILGFTEAAEPTAKDEEDLLGSFLGGLEGFGEESPAPPVVPVERTPPDVPSQPAPTPTPHIRPGPVAEFRPRSYPALSIISAIFHVLTALSVISWVALTVVMLFGVIASGDAAVAGIGLVTWIGWTFFAFVGCLLFLAAAENIRLFIHIQENTERTAWYASRR